MFSLSRLSSRPKSHSLFSFASCWTSVPLISAAVRCLGTGFCRQYKFIQVLNWTEHSEGEKKICSVLLITKIWHQEFPELCEWSITACSLPSLQHSPFPPVRNRVLGLWCVLSRQFLHYVLLFSFPSFTTSFFQRGMGSNNNYCQYSRDKCILCIWGHNDISVFLPSPSLILFRFTYLASLST